MRRENGAVTGMERFDFCFGEEDSVGVYGLECWCTGLILEDSP